MKRSLVLLFLVCSFCHVQAQKKQTSQKPVAFLLGTAFEFGGDKIAQVLFTDGSTQYMRAGQGGTLYAGAQFRLDKNSKLFLRSSIGIKYVTTKADNAHIRLTRIPLQASLNYVPAKNWRLAAGLVTHQAVRLNFDGIGENATFKASPGFVVEAAYSIVGISYTAMRYKDAGNRSFSANAIGFTFSGVF